MWIQKIFSSNYGKTKSEDHWLSRDAGSVVFCMFLYYFVLFCIILCYINGDECGRTGCDDMATSAPVRAGSSARTEILPYCCEDCHQICRESGGSLWTKFPDCGKWFPDEGKLLPRFWTRFPFRVQIFGKMFPIVGQKFPIVGRFVPI